MIVHSLELANFGRFTEPFRAVFDPQEVNLLAGPNGSGKSTLLGALSAAFLVHHASRGDDIRRCQPWGRAVAPSVTVEFTHRGQRYRLAKVWLLKHRLARLERLDGGGAHLVAENEAAEEMLPGLLGGGPGSGGVRSRQWLLAGVLWVRQNELGQIRVEGPVRDAVRAAFSAGARSRAVETVLREAGRLFEEDWTPKLGNLKLHSEARVLAGEEAALRLRVESLEHELGEIESMRESAAALAAECQRLEHALEPARERLAALDGAWTARQELLAKEKEAAQQEALLEAEYRRIQAVLDGRASAAARLASLEREQAGLSGRLAGARDEVSGADAALRAAVERAAARAAALEAELGACQAPDPGALAALERLQLELAGLRAQLSGALLHVEIHPEAAASIEVLSGETPGMVHLRPGEKQAVAGSPEIVLRIPGFGRLRVSGPAESAAALKRRIKRLEGEWAALSQPFGEAPVDELRRRRAQADELGRALAAARQEAAVHQAGRSAEASRAASAAQALQEVEERLRRLDTELGQARAERARLEAEPLSDEQLRARQSELALRLHGVREELTRLANLLAKDPPDLESARGAARTAAGNLGRKLDEARQTLRDVTAVLGEKQRRAPYSSLAEARAELEAKARARRAAELRAQANRLLFETLQAVLEEAEAGLAPALEHSTTAILTRIADNMPGPVSLDRAEWTAAGVRPAGLAAPVGLDCISGGEREQAHFAVRLALADLLTAEEPHLAVFDDALLATDAARMERIAELIAERRGRMQFLILTCHPERYAALQGARLVRVEARGAAP